MNKLTLAIIITACILSFSNCYADNAVTLPIIQVNAKPQQHNTNPANAITFTQKELQQQGSSSVTNFLKKQSIVTIQGHSSLQNQSGISIHGFGSNAATDTLLLIDDIPVSSFTDIGPNINSILVPNIQSISLIPGSYGTLYGDQAVGGVVKLETLIPDKPIAQVGIGVGNHAQKETQFFLSQAYPSHLGVSIGGQAYQTDHYQPHNNEDDYTFNSKIDYTAPRDLISLNLISYNTLIDVPSPEILNDPSPQPITDNHSHAQGNLAYLKNNWFMTDNWQWNSNASLLKSKLFGVMNFPFQTDQQSVLWQNHWKYKEILTNGIDLQQNQYSLDNTLLNRNVTGQVADIFSRVTIPMTDQLQFIVGGRAAKQWIDASLAPGNQTNNQRQALANEQGLVWHQTPNLDLFIRRDTNYRFAKADEIVWAPSNVNNLQTQTGISYETGATWKKSQTNVTVDFYQLDLNNEIAFDPLQNQPFGSMYNLPPTQRLGSDVIANTALTEKVLLDAQLGLVDPKIEAAPYQGKTIPNVSPINAGIGATYLGEKHWTTNLTEMYHSPFFASDDIQNQGPKLAGYFLTDLAFTKNWQQMTVNLQIDNLLNKHYARFASYEDGLIEFYPDDGITALASVTFDL